MALPTPPSTTHHDRDIRLPGSRVAWSQQNQYFVFTASPKANISLPRHLEHPAKSILKKCSQTFLPVPEDDTREVTPEPEDPLVNLTYLARPVSLIIDPQSSLRDVIEAYSVLNARIRAAVTDSTDGDSSWPLFQPLRKHTQALVDGICRDLGRALIEPDTIAVQDDEPPVLDCDKECDVEETCSLLPSPKRSPKKKKKGMSAAQVKLARDLCTTTHTVLRLLSAVFTSSAVYQLFSEAQLRDMLTHVLAIPMAEALPTPNARKTCALSIWLLQVQRLPEEVLLPARDRIAFALRRGMEGELGKEGKKGSACDGLKAIHDLSLYQPSTFVPAFVELLPSILSNLLAPTLTLRTQACHALGGFVLGVIALPPSVLHTRISNTVAAFLTTSAASPPRTTKTGNTSKPEPLIVRTLRSTLNASDPTHVAHGPVWALSVLACFIVLLGPKLCTDIQLTRIVSALLTLAIRNKKSSVRALGCLLWRCITWAYMRPPLRSELNAELDNEGVGMQDEDIQLARENFWKLIRSVVDMGVGVSTVAALITDELDDEDRLRKAIELVKGMIQKGSQACEDGMEITRIFVSFENTGQSWTLNKLLPHSLFSSNPGLLTAEYNGLSNVVRPIFDECPQLTDVRSLTREELSRDWVFDELIELWKIALISLRMTEKYALPLEITGIWEGLMKANVAFLLDADDHNGIVNFGTRAANLLADILGDHTLNFTSAAGVPSPTLSTPGAYYRYARRLERSSPSNASIKLQIVRELWAIMRTTFPNNLLHNGGAKILECLVEDEEVLTEQATTDNARTEWAYLCAETLVVCDVDELRKFWARRARSVALMPYEAGVQNLVWRRFVEKWREDAESSWEGAVVLLGVPFDKSYAWELNNEDFNIWDGFLRDAMDQARDGGLDAMTLLDHVAEDLARVPGPAQASFTRIADLLLTHFEIGDVRQIPANVFDFVNDTLLSTYPPEPRNLKPCTWLLATLTRIIDGCPVDRILDLLQTIQDGVSIWVADDRSVFSEDEYIYDVLPLYQTALLSLKDLPGDIDVLTTLSPFLHSAFIGRGEVLPISKEAFRDFWITSFADCDGPEEGWPEDIRACLRYCGLSSDNVPEDLSSELSEPPPSDATVCTYPASGTSSSRATSLLRGGESTCTTVHTESESDSESEVDSDDLPIIGRLRPASFTRFGDLGGSVRCSALTPAQVCTVLALSTPIKKLQSTVTPPRPQKPVTTPESYQSLILRPPAPTLPIPPSAPSTPKRTPPGTKSSSSVSPSKRAKLHDKENVSPSLPLSVTERLSARSSPGSSLSTASPVLGKRQALEESPYEGTPKKGRTISPAATFIRSSVVFPSSSESDLEEEMAVEASLFAPLGKKRPRRNGASHTELSQESPTSRKRKRSRLVFDAVVVPPLVDVRRQWQLQRRASAEDAAATPMSPPLLHRRLSLPYLRDSDGDNLPQAKRVKRLRHLEDAELSDASPRSSLKALEDIVIAGSDDSIIMAGPQLEHPGSDDDPHIGQVSPRHLASPAPRRRLGFDYDFSSDGFSSSPSRDLIARRQRRFGNVTGQT
ncbi:hypothetical protein M404DRAFT_1004540 [Pisolithus tinctorius Marx 270]|uniref:Telomere-associated protein Rif1 N-terminal domain-containing protein n=1 Tax=Pisolithus tinctorius Marx 270 TaxID=870435 RepID=A0A0C3NWL8_PISTI|nr:hypothetical protein M404DRAFT_1004540 [Pisolithus tinctorius Marx 270]